MTASLGAPPRDPVSGARCPSDGVTSRRKSPCRNLYCLDTSEP
ncbi:hypothetical protein JOC24_002042 [Streptomyces sp. HB132]|nr:hypothetical protein [Streptomyces sp. HB132]